MTLDSLALDALLDPNRARGQRRLATLKGLVARLVTGGACPECDAAGPHDDNGATGVDLSFCCRACGEHWDAVSS